jgi:hypothetical protein
MASPQAVYPFLITETEKGRGNLLNVNYALVGIIIFLAIAIIRVYVREQKARKADLDYAYGFLGKDTNGMTPAQRQAEVLRLRNESRRHLETRGYRFDYSKAEADNQARRLERENEREDTLIRFLAERAEEERRRASQAEVISIETLQRRADEPSQPKEATPVRERGLTVLYPRNKSNAPRPPKPRTRRRVKKRDGTSSYQLGQTISPVYGVVDQRNAPAEQAVQSIYPSTPVPDGESVRARREERELERRRRHEETIDDTPMNLEEAYVSHLDKVQSRIEDTRREKARQEILNRDISVKEYLENIRAVDEYRKKAYGQQAI